MNSGSDGVGEATTSAETVQDLQADRQVGLYEETQQSKLEKLGRKSPIAVTRTKIWTLTDKKDSAEKQFRIGKRWCGRSNADSPQLVPTTKNTGLQIEQSGWARTRGLDHDTGELDSTTRGLPHFSISAEKCKKKRPTTKKCHLFIIDIVQQCISSKPKFSDTNDQM